MRVVELPLSDDGGEHVLVQVRETDPDAEPGVVRVGRAGEPPIGRAARSLDAMLGVVHPVAERFVARFSGMEQPPDEISLDFGISLSAEADVLIATTSGEANFSVTLTWHRRQDQP
ncbi:CU044_2847 family protein [Streptomyces litchfieldiae]|uniref:CU044_2847 family protein n=1 Tax=Streptomyces litchfieldiae TaxID=3075543 RepID=A0ABU2MTH4_9ACTN|nr:CU044_2847 family protein [Streptomyces sp. DSM 44938]MDT0344830.1 CU044_2847 family protein [Streptomyces sp. DSM 44938]